MVYRSAYFSTSAGIAPNVSGLCDGGASDKRITQIAAAKEQARQEIEIDTKLKAAKKAAKLQMLQNA